MGCCLSRGKNALGFKKADRLEQLLTEPYTRAMVDIPIGLPKGGYRRCDLEAKKLVGPKVFLGARGAVWSFETIELANAHYGGAKDTGISIQLWSIREKPQEANKFISPARQQKVMETHPELDRNRRF